MPSSRRLLKVSGARRCCERGSLYVEEGWLALAARPSTISSTFWRHERMERGVRAWRVELIKRIPFVRVVEPKGDCVPGGGGQARSNGASWWTTSSRARELPPRPPRHPPPQPQAQQASPSPSSDTVPPSVSPSHPSPPPSPRSGCSLRRSTHCNNAI